MVNIWKIDYSAVHDGPGIRTSLYLKGCPLRCTWCSNPEGNTSEPNLVFIQSRCIDCGQCVERCPAKAIELRRDPGTQRLNLHVNRENCNLCEQCVSVCAPKALEIWGRNYTIPELLQILEKNRPMYRKSGGGVTLTGGDPLYQWESVADLIEQCRRRGIHTVVETSGFAEEEPFERILRSVDWLFIDLKHMDAEDHARLTGRSNARILENVKLASSVMRERKRDLVVRMVVVPGVNDGDNISKTAQFLRDLPYLKGLEFLPYHRYATTKYELLHRPYRLIDLEPPSEGLMEDCRKVMLSHGVTMVC
jgi:pyruvate formate lyase activating enzyme